MDSKRNNQGISVLRSGISVYEVEVCLGKYASVRTNEIDGFPAKLLRMFPALRAHECYAGETGGFVAELKKGTDLAHVMEHLILELLKSALRPHRRFTGWTRKKGKNYVIHFQAPDGPVGRCAALSSIKVIESILGGKRVNKRAIIRKIRESKEAPPCE
jgi:cyanophycin synthetase